MMARDAFEKIAAGLRDALAIAKEQHADPGRAPTAVSRAAVERWLDGHALAMRLMSEDQLVALAMKNSRGKADPAMVRDAIHERLARQDALPT